MPSHSPKPVQKRHGSPKISRNPPAIPELGTKASNTTPNFSKNCPPLPKTSSSLLKANPLPPPSPPLDVEECLKGMAVLPPLCPPCPPRPCAPSKPQESSVTNTQKKKVFGKENLLEEIRQKGGTMGAGLRKLQSERAQDKQAMTCKNDGSLTFILQNALDVIHSATRFSDNDEEDDDDDACDSW
jgi:hypothetical protein